MCIRDSFRIGTTFLSYQKFQKILIDRFEYEGSIQLHLHAGEGLKKEKVIIKIENLFKASQTPESLLKTFMDEYSDLRLVVKEDLVLDFEVQVVERKDLTFSSSTGKLRSVIDHRI